MLCRSHGIIRTNEALKVVAGHDAAAAERNRDSPYVHRSWRPLHTCTYMLIPIGRRTSGMSRCPPATVQGSHDTWTHAPSLPHPPHPLATAPEKEVTTGGLVAAFSGPIPTPKTRPMSLSLPQDSIVTPLVLSQIRPSFLTSRGQAETL